MTPEEHAHVQELEAKVKRYRSRIAELKNMRPKFLCPHCSHFVELDSIIEHANARKEIQARAERQGETPNG